MLNFYKFVEILVSLQSLVITTMLPVYIPLTTMVNRITGKDPTYGVSLSFISVEAKNKNSLGE